jgi:hypothetical protein
VKPHQQLASDAVIFGIGLAFLLGMVVVLVLGVARCIVHPFRRSK